MKQLENLRDELKRQNVPDHWQIMVISAMNQDKQRIELMKKWLKENEDLDYKSMDLVNAVLEIKSIVPIKDEFALNINIK